MDALERYNAARDREQHAFECSPLGELVRLSYNRRVHHAEDRAKHPEWEPIMASLPAEYVFGARYPAFYAGRSLGIW